MGRDTYQRPYDFVTLHDCSMQVPFQGSWLLLEVLHRCQQRCNLVVFLRRVRGQMSFNSFQGNYCFETTTEEEEGLRGCPKTNV